jgi:DNA-binding MarR family transcriptional regulator
VHGLDRGGRRDDVDEGLEQAAMLVVRHVSDRTALNLTAILTLGTLHREGPIRVMTLAAAMGTSQPSMTQMVRRLARHGRVIRVDDPEDGRAALVTITKAGRALLDDRLPEMRAALPTADEASLTLAMQMALPLIRRLICEAQ